MKVGKLTLENKTLFAVLGPCVIEDEEMTVAVKRLQNSKPDAVIGPYPPQPLHV